MEDYVEAFEKATVSSGSPLRFRTWAAISAVAGAMERKRWVHTLGSDLYPNLYVILAAPPGIGKSKILREVMQQWGTLPDHKLAPSSVYKASLIDELNEAKRTVMLPGRVPPTETFNSLKVLSLELGVLLPDYSNDFMNVLTDIYDGTPYGERRRTKDINISIPKPQLNLLAGTTPSYLKSFLPAGAWDQGFLSRTILIYATEIKKTSLFVSSRENPEERKALGEILKKIGKAYGEFQFSQEAMEAIDAWYLGGCHPAPDHPKLIHYLTRRPAHLLKLCMVSAASRLSKDTIELVDFQRALDWLVEAEAYMPEIFKSMSNGGDLEAIQECWHFCYKLFMRSEKKPVPQHKLVAFLQERVPAYNIEKILTIMVKGQLLKEHNVNKIGVCYEPLEQSLPE